MMGEGCKRPSDEKETERGQQARAGNAALTRSRGNVREDLGLASG